VKDKIMHLMNLLLFYFLSFSSYDYEKWMEDGEQFSIGRPLLLSHCLD
jgi:hypothetical protein